MEACFFVLDTAEGTKCGINLTEQNFHFFVYNSFDKDRMLVTICIKIPSMGHHFLQLLVDALFILYTVFVDVFVFKEPVDFQAPV
jgi:hypothetical protein